MSISRRGKASFFRINWASIVVLLTILLPQGSARADNIPPSFKTSAGVVEVKPGAGPTCNSKSYDEQCLLLYIAGKLVASETHLSITTILPSKERPYLLGVETWTGGNACCWESYIVDVSTDKPHIFRGYSLDPNAQLIGPDVFFDAIKGQNKVGDSLLTTYHYRIGSGIILSIVKSHPQYSDKPLANGIYPFDILGNPRLREPLIRLIGEEKFAEYRKYLDISGPIKIINNQYIVGSGCKAHACGAQFGIFVIDTKNNLAWALAGDEGKFNQGGTARRWGILTQDDVVPREEILRWQQEKHIAFADIKDVFLSEKMISVYLQPRSIQAISVPSTTVRRSAETQQALTQSVPASSETDIAMGTDGGTFVVPVTINNTITLDFILDSGAADVSIPIDVIMTLMRTGTIASTDFLGEQTYRLADGSTVPSKTFLIRSLSVGGKTLQGVVGSVAPLRGSLLLGQSFLGRFKSWSIDNEKHALVLR